MHCIALLIFFFFALILSTLPPAADTADRNPAAEMQAIDRTHRLGQHKPIFATRFIIENSIEERILKLQEKKKLVFDGTVGGDAGSMARLTVDDMRFLFQ